MRVHLHVPPHAREKIEEGRAQFWTPLADLIRGTGGEVALRRYEARSHDRIDPDDGELHIVNNGAIGHANVLNAALAYVDGYWHLDPRGVLSVSSIGERRFDPEEVDVRAARALFRTLRRRHVERRRSRYKQPRGALGGDMPEGAVALFLQGPSHLTDRARLCSTPDMIRSVARGAGRPVRVKAHPLKVAPEDLTAVEEMAGEGHDVALVDGNVHDLLARCCAAVSISSACSFEAFLHRKPAILYGRSDFAQNAVEVRDLDRFEEALEEATSRRWPHVGFVHWYLAEQCLDARADDFGARALRVLAAAGYRANVRP